MSRGTCRRTRSAHERRGGPRGLAALAIRGASALSRGERLEIFREIVAGTADPAQIGALLLGLAIRGERPR
jgi:anthranilate phosphoribosyltransferase